MQQGQAGTWERVSAFLHICGSAERPSPVGMVSWRIARTFGEHHLVAIDQVCLHEAANGLDGAGGGVHA